MSLVNADRKENPKNVFEPKHATCFHNSIQDKYLHNLANDLNEFNLRKYFQRDILFLLRCQVPWESYRGIE